MATNQLFQFSIISALMEGVASEGLPLSTVLANGNQGLGTFRHLVGELIVLDGKAYQMKTDGTVTHIDVSGSTDVVSPFAQVTRFAPSVVTKVELSSKDSFVDFLSGLLPDARNHYLAFRIDGLFKDVTVRTVGGQEFPHECLRDVAKRQVSVTFAEPIKGTMVGFRSPEYMQGITVAGEHLHFISEDRTRGGHVLAFSTGEPVDVAVAQIWTVQLELPRDNAEFNGAPLKDDSEGIKAVEG